MIQRIQSIWLLLAAITILSLLLIPILGVATENEYFVLQASGLHLEGAKAHSTNISLFISIILAGLISLVNIFNFANRKLQIKIAYFNVVLILVLSFWLFQIAKSVERIKTLDIEPGIFLPLAAVIFTLLAIKGIKNDEKLIRSADRLR